MSHKRTGSGHHEQTWSCTFDFEPYGLEIQSGDADHAWWTDTASNDRWFTSHERDSDLNGTPFQDYMKARAYSLATGRFDQQYPVFSGPQETSFWNECSYVSGNPVNYWDPFGTEEKRTKPGWESQGYSSYQTCTDECTRRFNADLRNAYLSAVGGGVSAVFCTYFLGKAITSSASISKIFGLGACAAVGSVASLGYDIFLDNAVNDYQTCLSGCQQVIRGFIP